MRLPRVPSLSPTPLAKAQMTTTYWPRNPTPIRPIFLFDFSFPIYNKNYSYRISSRIFAPRRIFLHNGPCYAFLNVLSIGGFVKVEEILAGIDQEIARLQHARNLLAGDQP